MSLNFDLGNIEVPTNPNINIKLGMYLHVSVPQVEMAILSKIIYQCIHDLDL
jgi:hypothetical protein